MGAELDAYEWEARRIRYRRKLSDTAKEKVKLALQKKRIENILNIINNYNQEKNAKQNTARSGATNHQALQ